MILKAFFSNPTGCQGAEKWIMDDYDYVPTDKIDFYNPIERYPDRVDKNALRPDESPGGCSILFLNALHKEIPLGVVREQEELGK